MLKSYTDVISLNNTLAGMSRDRWPFGVTLAKNIKLMDKLITEYNEKREEIINKYAKRDDAGALLGILRAVEVAEGEEPRTERVQNPTRIDETEWTDRATFDAEVFELNKQEVEIELSPVDVATTYYNMQANRDMTILQFVDANMEPSLVLYLSDYGFFKNIEM